MRLDTLLFSLSALALAGCGSDPAPSPPVPPPTPPVVAPPPPSHPEPEAPARPPGPVPRLVLGSSAFYGPLAVRAIAVVGDEVYVGRDGPRVERFGEGGTRSMFFDFAPPPAPSTGLGTIGGAGAMVQALDVVGDRLAVALGAGGAAVVNRLGEGDLFRIESLDIVHDVALLPDGSLVTAHGGEAYANGHHIVEMHGDCGLCFWSPTGARTATVAPADAGGWVTALAATADGSTVVTGASDGRLRVYDARGTLVREIRAGDRRIERITITEPERVILFANDSGDLARVALDGTGRSRLFGGDAVTTAAAMGSARLGWVGDDALHVLGEGGARSSRVYHSGLSALEVDGEDLLVGDYRGHVRRFHDGGFTSGDWAVDDLAWDETGAHLVVRRGTELGVYAAATGAIEHGPRTLPDYAARVALRSGGRLLVQTNAISMREEDLATGEHASGAASGGGESINHVVVSRDRSAWAWATYDRVHVGSTRIRVPDGVGAIALSDDGTEIAVATQGTPPGLEVRSAASGEVRWHVELAHFAGALAWSGDAILTSQGDDVMPEMRHASDGSVGPHLTRCESGGGVIAVSPGGTYLALGCPDGTTTLLHTGGGAGHGFRNEHLGPITVIAFSPDGAELATGSADGTVRIWAIPAGE